MEVDLLPHDWARIRWWPTGDGTITTTSIKRAVEISREIVDTTPKAEPNFKEELDRFLGGETTGVGMNDGEGFMVLYKRIINSDNCLEYKHQPLRRRCSAGGGKYMPTLFYNFTPPTKAIIHFSLIIE